MICNRLYGCVVSMLFVSTAGMFGSGTDASEHYKTAIAALENKQFDQAIAEFTEAIRLDPKCIEAYYGRGSSYAGKADYAKAAADYGQIIALNPQDAGAYSSRAAALDHMGKDDAALSDYSKAIQLDPEYPKIYYNRALFYARRENQDKAIADFSEAIHLDLNDHDSYYCRANCYVSKGDFRRAISDYTTTIRLHPRMMSAYNNRGNAYRELGEYDKALSDYERAIKLDPNCPHPYSNRAWLWASSSIASVRNGEKALGDARKACELTNWKEAGYLECLAGAYAELGDFKSAVKWQKKAVRLSKSYPEKQRILLQERLKLYERNKPFRQVVVESTKK